MRLADGGQAGQALVAAGDCLINEGAPDESSAAEHQNPHDATFCRSPLNSRNALRRERT
jgi:hypothetical protein